jgi:hypothetical protein
MSRKINELEAVALKLVQDVRDKRGALTFAGRRH